MVVKDHLILSHVIFSSASPCLVFASFVDNWSNVSFIFHTAALSPLLKWKQTTVC